MKKLWLPLVFAVFLLLAPIAAAADGSAPGWLEGLIDQILALWVGEGTVTGDQQGGATVPADQPEIGASYPPHG